MALGDDLELAAKPPCRVQQPGALPFAAWWRLALQLNGQNGPDLATNGEPATAFACHDRLVDIKVTVDESGGFDPIRTDDLPVSGKDGHGQKTPTVRELAAILSSLPGQFQELPVTRYCDEGVAAVDHSLNYERDPWDRRTAHIALR
jgi:hypothetical protein